MPVPRGNLAGQRGRAGKFCRTMRGAGPDLTPRAPVRARRRNAREQLSCAGPPSRRAGAAGKSRERFAGTETRVNRAGPLLTRWESPGTRAGPSRGNCWRAGTRGTCGIVISSTPERAGTKAQLDGRYCFENMTDHRFLENSCFIHLLKCSHLRSVFPRH